MFKDKVYKNDTVFDETNVDELIKKVIVAGITYSTKKQTTS